ncbi:MAG TPA: M1 family aminopeptidase [Steroidobacteraceae bacterium]|nr:M1 family aminopeptidase [Steroidobacteraceae bacterium]
MRKVLCLLLFVASPLIAGHSMAAEDYPQGKLPDAATPIAYRLDLTIVPDEPRFSGHVEIDVSVKAATRSLFIHGRELTVHKAVALVGKQQIKAKYSELDQLGVARLDFDRELPSGRATLVFDYDGPFGNTPAGLYRLKIAGDWYSWTQFESIDARAAFPSFDEPGHKTPFAVSLTTKPGYLALSNAPETGKGVKRGDLVKHTFAETKPLPTYLVAFVVGPFITVEGAAPPTALRKTPLPLRIVATKNQAGRLDYALAETPRIIELLENYFGHAFPFPKLDQIASPVMGGAMENAGADIYDDNIILLDKGASTHQKQMFGMVVAHELSHQWFGDYVTPAWWDDLWLNESFANWMGFRIGNEWRPELNIGVNAIDEALAAMGTDALTVGRPIHQPILTNGEIDSAFDRITYGKGGQVIGMIAAYLGDEKFREGVRLHMRRHPYGNATSDEFFGALADAAHDPRVLKSMQSFVDQQGVPVVDLTPEGSQFKATQSRYSIDGTAPDQVWVIPFCARRGEKKSCTLLDSKTQTIAIEGRGTIIPNVEGTGYYRYNLTPSDWNALIAAAPTLSAGEALAAADSLWSQFKLGNVTAMQTLDAARVFAGHKDSNVAIAMAEYFSGWREYGLIGKAQLADYQKTIASIYGPRLREMGFDPAVGAHSADDPDQQKLRQSLVGFMSAEAHDASIRKKLIDAADSYLKGNASALDQSFYQAAFSTYVQDGTLETAKHLYERMVTSQDELFRNAALIALGDSRQAQDVNWVLSQFGDERLRSTDRIVLLQVMMLNEASRDIAFDWLKANYDELAKRSGVFAASRIPSLPSHYCSAAKADEIDRLLRPKVQQAGRGELPFNRMLESIRTCGILQEKRAPELAAALRGNAS